MTIDHDIWLVANPASGSNDEAALSALTRRCAQAGLCLTRTIAFPDEPLPTPADLDAAGVDVVAVFAGDGTINSLVTALDGWAGAVLVLPGGTMNLLSIRLHGSRDCDGIVDAVARGHGRRTRPGTVETAHGTALAGLLVGPATAWGGVREAMRDLDVPAIVGETVEAVSESTEGVPVCCASPPAGRAQGYPLLMLTPEDGHFSIKAYHAEGIVEYARQGLAILRRNFREGPHDDLGNFTNMTVASADGSAIDLLIDGEHAAGAGTVLCSVGACGVDLIATDEA